MTVRIPPGVWTLNQTVYLNTSRVALRGAGPSRTVLHYPVGLEAVYGSGKAWEYSGAFLG